MNTRRILCLLSMLLTAPAGAHHAFAPHYDSNRPVSLFGTIIEYERRNPHAYINLRVENEDGSTEQWRCESDGVTALSRKGLTPDMLEAGTQVGISGSRHRRNPFMCFFDTVFFPDGREISLDAASRPDAEVARRDSMFGTWLISPAGRTVYNPAEMMNYLTPEGQAAVDDYDPFTDDPTYRCEPIGIRRGWFAVDTPMAIRRSGENILIQHEWMDIERVVHMNQTEAPDGTGPTILGYSVGHFEGDTLVVETDHFTEGVLNQYVEVDGEQRGLLHSDALRTVERITFDPVNNRIQLELEHEDPVFYTRKFPVTRAQYDATDLEITPFGCIPEQLN